MTLVSAARRMPATKPVGKPDAGNPHVRFDERGGETDRLRGTAPILDSTRADIRDDGEIWAPAGYGRTSFVDVRDVADAVVRVLTEPGHERRAYTLTGGEAFNMNEVAALLSDVLGRRITYRNPGIPAFLRHIRASGGPIALGLVMIGVYTAARLGWAAAVSPDLEQLIERPPTSLRAFVADYAAVWQ